MKLTSSGEGASAAGQTSNHWQTHTCLLKLLYNNDLAEINPKLKGEGFSFLPSQLNLFASHALDYFSFKGCPPYSENATFRAHNTFLENLLKNALTRLERSDHTHNHIMLS